MDETALCVFRPKDIYTTLEILIQLDCNPLYFVWYTLKLNYLGQILVHVDAVHVLYGYFWFVSQ